MVWQSNTPPLTSWVKDLKRVAGTFMINDKKFGFVFFLHDLYIYVFPQHSPLDYPMKYLV